MVSVAGGWFFLMACEMFVLGTRDFRLPGLGSYLQTAASTGDGKAIAWGLLTMITIIVATDQLIWRPIIAWSDKFKFEQVETKSRINSPLLHLLQHSRALKTLSLNTIKPLSEAFYQRIAEDRSTQARKAARLDDAVVQQRERWVGLLRGVVLAVIFVALLYAAFH